MMMTDLPRHCLNCQAELQPGEPFCSQCGSPVFAAQPPPAPVETGPATVVVPSTTDVKAVSQSAADASDPQLGSLAANRSGNLIIPVNGVIGFLVGALMVACCILAVLGGALGTGVLLSSANPKLSWQGLVDATTGPAMTDIFASIPTQLVGTPSPTPTVVDGTAETVEPLLLAEGDLSATPQASATGAATPLTTPVAGQPASSITPTDISGESVEYEGVRLIVPSAVANNAYGETLPADTAGSPDEPFSIYPETTAFYFENYQVPVSYTDQILMIFPVAEYESIDSGVGAKISALRRLLDSRSTTGQATLPLIPGYDGEQIFYSNVKFFNFKNGRGVRYITMYGDEVSPVNNETLMYIYQGLTDDGEYLVSALLPVNSPILPDSYEIPDGDYDAFEANYDQYISDITKKLNAEAEPRFLPNLQLVDGMLLSLSVRASP